MVISPPDRINYFIGVVLLTYRSNEGEYSDEEYVQKFVRILRFDPAFYEFTVRNVLNNIQAIDDPPSFAGHEIAKIFIKDCLRIAFIRGTIDTETLNWLYQVVKKNQLREEWFAKELLFFLTGKTDPSVGALEIEKYV